MNFVPFELQTKKKEVINLNKMEEEETELINLINSTWEEMAPSAEKGNLGRMEEGVLPCPGRQLPLPSYQMPGGR